MKKTKSKKVLIFTQCDMLNYGNRLQNFGLATFLSSHFNVEVFNCWPSDVIRTKSKIVYPLKKGILFLSLFFKRPLGKWLKKYNSSKKLTKKFGVDRTLLFPGNSLKMINSKYDFLLLGSDQVVNNEFGLPDKIVSFSFVDDEKKISYAISAGNDVVNHEKYSEFLECFPTFNGKSVREDFLKEQLLDFSPNKHVDPSLLLKKEEWLSFSLDTVSKSIKKYIGNDYLLVYWLGTETEQDRFQIETFAKKKSLEIIYLRTNSFDTYNTIVDASPLDFIYLIANAKFVISKSYHGCMFSVLMNKPFYGIDKFRSSGSFDERYAELTRRFEVPEECFEGINECVPSFDWAKINNHINKERVDAFNYFKLFFEEK